MMRTLLILALALMQPLYASEHRGTVSYNGLPVPGATVIAMQGEKKSIAISDPQGMYFFPDLSNGLWAIQVEMLGFKPMKREISIGSESPAAEWELNMLSMNEMNAEPIPAAFQQTEISAPESNTDTSSAGDSKKSGAFDNFSAEQLSERAADGFLINGSVNNGADSSFAQRMAFGNNRRIFPLYNGSFGLTLDNSAFNARNYSLTGQSTPKPDYNRMQLSLTVGGPVKIPFLMQKTINSFLSYQRTQNRNASIYTSRMPTEEERNGNLSQARDSLDRAIQISDPDTGRPFDGNIIPPGRISPQASSLLSLYPFPNSENGGRYNYQTTVVSGSHQDNIQGSLNCRQMSSQISGNFSYQSTRSDSPNIFAFLDKTMASSLSLAGNFSHSFGQRSGMGLRVQFTRTTSRLTPFFAHRMNISGIAGITGNNQDPGNWGPPNLAFSNYAQLTDGKASFDRDWAHAVSITGRMSRGEHNLTAGFEFRRQQFNAYSQQDARGTYSFNGAATGYDFADFLLGIPDASSIAYGNADKYFRGSNYAVYINDDFRVRSGFTLNSGVRWEYESPVTERYGRLVNLDIASDFQALAPVLASEPNGLITGEKYFSSLINPDKRGVQPRVGFAWRPKAASSFVVRGGYGLYRDTSVYRAIAVQMAQQSPLSKNLMVGNSPATPLTLANGFDFQPNAAVNNFAIDPDFRVANAQNWQLSMQLDFPLSMQMVVMYQGAKGSHLTQKSYPNTYPEGSLNPCTACPSGFLYQSSNGASIRHAGILQLRRRMRHGFEAEARYTFSKSIDDAALGGTQAAQNWLDLKAERALSNFDQRHVLQIETQYTSSAGGFKTILMNGWAAALLKAWTFSGNIMIGSGAPLTPMYSAVVPGTGITGIIRPNRTSASIYSAPTGLFLNPAAFSPPEPGAWGNAGRNSIAGPRQFTMDASLGRAFRVRDRYNIEFRIVSSNILNHVTYPSWNTVINSSQFGLPNLANPMRTFQANMRVSF
jgi:hypothetical protein